LKKTAINPRLMIYSTVKIIQSAIIMLHAKTDFTIIKQLACFCYSRIIIIMMNIRIMAKRAGMVWFGRPERGR
jgi:hypothetical protein